MSTIDQCPSTKGKLDIQTPEPSKATGAARQWRSVEAFAASEDFGEFLHREFPAGASELANDKAETRREFLKLMAAGLALAGAATIPGCRRPDHKILAYSADEPEHTIPGKALYYATAMPLPGGGAEGLLIETHSHRPTKVEGNPLHPNNRGKTSAMAQASILGLYDPDRLKYPRYRRSGDDEKIDATWDDFKLWQSSRMAEHEATGGADLAFVVDWQSGPTMLDMRRRVLARFPKATWVWWDAVDARRSELEGTRMAIGSPSRVYHDFSKASVILSLGSDFVDSGPAHMTSARDFAATRRVMKSGDAMSRLYVLEAAPTGTGSMADHRFAVSPSDIARFTLAVTKAVGELVGASNLTAGAAAKIEGAGYGDAPVFDHVAAIAADLVEASKAKAGSAIVVAGPEQPAEVHALVCALNAMLGANDSTVTYTAEERTFWEAPAAALGKLTDRMNAGAIRTLVTVGVNPAYDAPAGVDFAAAMSKVETSVAWSVEMTETAAAATWELSGTHYLESWGDAEAYDGTLSVIQPMIAPLYEPQHSAVELLALLSGEDEPDGYELVQSVWSRRMGMSIDDPGFKKAFRRAVQDGVLVGSERPLRSRAPVAPTAVATAAGSLTEKLAAAKGGIEAVFTTGRLADGRFANNGWLQELPQIGTQVVWDNPAVVSPKTAEELGLLPVGVGRARGDMAGAYTRGQIPRARVGKVSVGGREVEAPFWILPGMPDNVVVMQVGYGRTEVGRVGDNVGVNVYPLRDPAAAMATASIERTSGTFPISSTQNHWSMESRTSIVRAMDKKWWDQHAAEFEKKEGDVKKTPDKIYGTTVSETNLAEQLGELSHTPANISLYVNPQNASRDDPAAGSAFAKGPQWGMSIDLAACSGCGVCTVACQSENNIPIVGKQEVAKGREMTWIRVDRYFTGDDLNSPMEMVSQPVACVHCENAPCETVCPVNATVHGPEGTNNMAYNRCIGTRYCANNCPYKARRFNFFDYGVTKYNGEFLGQEVLESFTGDETLDQRSFNKNFIPPRLREKLDEISHMQKNPDVTVRSRGVMEKCTYCIQRINEARQEAKVTDVWRAGQNTEMGPGYEAPIPDGFFQVACQQACPTGAIVFGDILDPTSKVTEMRDNQRTYGLLAYLNTRPRTSYMLRVRNPNPEIGGIDGDHDPLHHGAGHGAGHGGDHGDSHGDHGDEHHGDDHDHSHGDGDHASGGGSSWFDRRRAGERGYLASLPILS